MQTIDYIRLFKINKYGGKDKNGNVITDEVLERDYSKTYPYSLIAGDTEEEDKLNKKLKHNRGYHYQYKDIYYCIAYGDIDKCETIQQVLDILKYICDMYGIDTDEMSYTLSNPEPNSYGTHWTIPKMRTNIPTLKIRMEKLGEKININGVKYVDPSVYKTKGFLRLPNQTNKNKPTKHKIIQGKPIDFLLHYVFNSEYDDFEEIKEDVEIKEYTVDSDLICVNINYPLLNILADQFESYSDWSRMCWIMKSLKYEFSVFDEYSRKYPKKYDEKGCKEFWKKCKVSKINEGILYGLAKEKNPAEFDKLKLEYAYKEDVIPVQTIEMTEEQIIKNDNYLIHKDNINLDFEDCLISNKLIDFFNFKNLKSFNIKSPYDTGKTKLLTRILTKYPQKRILFLSYRKTLTSDLMASFKDFDFKDYRKVVCNETDKLIIQLESINKIKPSFMLVDEECDIPSFDLVIIDELESVLQQFSSRETFGGESKEAFEFISAIINNSKKLITLDGDLSYRGFNYIKQFGESINIINPVKKNKKIFTLIDSENNFHDEITESLTNKEKIVIVSQTSNKCNNMYAYIKKKFPKIKMSIYTGSTSDLNKTDLDDVKKNWSLLDVLIYSPTIEAGVNFDVLHFDKIYGIVCSNCNSQRAFCQMLARVRKTKDNNILLYASSLQYKKISKNKVYSFDEVQNTLIALDIIKINEVYEGSKIIKRLTPYDTNYIYNKIEELMKHKYYYLGYLELLLKNKGHDFINNIKPKEKAETIKADIKESKLASSEKFLTIDDITEGRFKTLMNRQKTSTASEIDKLQIKKYLIKLSLGLDKIDNEILEKYDSPTIIKKIEFLIDPSNIPKYKDNETIEYTKKTEIINDLINKLGFKLFDNKRISREEFVENTKDIVINNELFTNPNQSKILFNSSKVDIKTNRQFLGFINTVLENYKLKIYSHDIKIKKKDIEKLGKTNSTEYSLGFLPGYEHINEFLQYKINKGYKLLDTKKIRPESTTEKYKHLILSDDDKIKYNDLLAEIECDIYDEEYKKEFNIIDEKPVKNNIVEEKPHSAFTSFQDEKLVKYPQYTKFKDSYFLTETVKDFIRTELNRNPYIYKDIVEPETNDDIYKLIDSKLKIPMDYLIKQYNDKIETEITYLNNKIMENDITQFSEYVIDSIKTNITQLNELKIFG